MKLILVILTVALAASAAEIRSSFISNLNVGSVGPDDRLLASVRVNKPARPNSFQYEDYVYTGSSSTRITAVSAKEVGNTQYALAFILRGGLGSNEVTVRVQSTSGFGYDYQIEVWGQ